MILLQIYRLRVDHTWRQYIPGLLSYSLKKIFFVSAIWLFFFFFFWSCDRQNPNWFKSNSQSKIFNPRMSISRDIEVLKKKKKPWQNKFKKTMKHIFMKGVVRCHKSKKWQYLKYPRKLRKQGKPPHPAYFCLLFHYPPTVILRFSDIYKVMILVCVGTVKVSMTDSCKEPNSLAK